MNKNALMQAMMGDYRPEIQRGPNAGTQQRLMQQQFPDPGSNIDPAQVQKMADLLSSQGKSQMASDLLGAVAHLGIGGGVGAGLLGAGLPVAAPLVGGGLLAGAGSQYYQDEADKSGLLHEGINSRRYPGIYGSQ